VLLATEFRSLHATVYSFTYALLYYTQTKIRHMSKYIDSDMKNIEVMTELPYTQHCTV